MRPFDPRLLRYARSARRHILLTGVLGLATAALVIVQALLISAAASPVITGEKAPGDVVPLIWALLGVVVARALAVAAREATAHRGADAAIRDLRAAVIDRAEALGPRWRARHGADTTTLVTRGLDDLAPYFVKFLPQLFLVSTVTPLALLTILLLDFWSALIALVVLPLIPVFMILIGRFTQDASAAKLASMERLGSQLLDLMAGLPTLRGLGREHTPRSHLRALGRANTRTTMSTLSIAFLSGAVLEFLATISVALVAVEVGMRLVHGNIDLFSGLAVIMLTPEVFEPLRQVGTQFHASANGVAAANSAFAVIEEPGDSLRTATAPDARVSTIVLDSVSVAARGAWAPAGLSATIRPGTVSALVGPSGAGKTTTVQTILGVEDPTLGRVLLDGPDGPVDLADVDRESWWSQITWVPQNPTIAPGTILDNLNADEAGPDLVRAARATGFLDVVDSLPDGWSTRIGLGGAGLSVGQRQRLALTRALLDDAPLVILDEPTAHLDAVSEDVVVDAIRALRGSGRTVLVIAHRSAVVALADERIRVETRSADDAEIAAHPGLTPQAQAPITAPALPGFLDPALQEGPR
ncbi:thiol reductant ABC exporter subunit CydD [Actinomyces sp. B33]|uniref:thiol reductant ABC exporter subunit CydD n=1 Tax=Actinomyces sp. B33 TaxID=2942131 RepID=UPI002341A21D|nr:thiol reductant ABC exporter subunit CydD [Actinomyces sp. B33]MDC4233120.1 thiol reductant ABC exporter subunit CydD [Actinomyces sp. B33]